MQRFRSLETLVPQKAAAYGEVIRRAATMARAGILVPAGFALSREHTDAMLEASGLPLLVNILDDLERPEIAARVPLLKAEWLARPLPYDIQDALRGVAGRLEGQGARGLALSVVLVCGRADCERVLGRKRVGIEGSAALIDNVHRGIAALFEPSLLEELSARGVRDAGVSLLVQRAVDGFISGVAFTRHPITGDTREWLLRAGYGLAGRLRRGDAPSDVLRVTRDGFVRDVVVQSKSMRFMVDATGAEVVLDVPEGLRERPALREAQVPDVLRLATRVEGHLGAPVAIEWALDDGQAYLLHADLLVADEKPNRSRPFAERSRVVWSHQEVGEALPDVLAPLSWSLLRRFAPVGLAGALSAGGAALSGTAGEVVIDVRGRAYLNLTEIAGAVSRLPVIGGPALAALGIAAKEARPPEHGMGLLELARTLLRFSDTQFRYVRDLPWVAAKVNKERAHFAGIDTRLLSPEAVERVLCDVEAWLNDAGVSLMRCYGLWASALIALRTILTRYCGEEGLRLERDLLWGPSEVLPSSSAASMLALARSLSTDAQVRAWVDGEGEVPELVPKALLELTLARRHDALSWMDPSSPRLSELVPTMLGVLRSLLADPMALALAADRAELVHGRRERAEREWKRRIPMVLWPAVQVLITRLRALTKQREALLVDAAQAITELREIALDASRRLSMREPGLGTESAFLLHVEELHDLLCGRQWDVRARLEQRRVELRLTAALPPSPRVFQGGLDEHAHGPLSLVGVFGSGGAAEGRIVRVTDGHALQSLPPAAVLVVNACDLGLAPFMPGIRAVIAECGGMLSHGVMLGSALGVPVVVGVPGALSQLADGERVRVDGDRACVERIGAGQP